MVALASSLLSSCRSMASLPDCMVKRVLTEPATWHASASKSDYSEVYWLRLEEDAIPVQVINGKVGIEASWPELPWCEGTSSGARWLLMPCRGC